MSGSHLIRLLVLLISLHSAVTIQKLNSIKDLKTVPFGRSVPVHSLVLLHWFANNVEIDNNDAVQLTFDPQSGDYGTHHYGNYEGILAPLPQGRVNYRYFTLGNLNNMNNQLNPLPPYVTQHLNMVGQEERNRDRIVFRVRTENQNRPQTIDQVFITQHYDANEGLGTSYDTTYTYQVTSNLLREIRVFSLENHEWDALLEIRDHFGSSINHDQLRSIRNKWGEFACLGLLLFIVIKERKVPRKPKNKCPSPLRDQQRVTGIRSDHTVVIIPGNASNYPNDTHSDGVYDMGYYGNGNEQIKLEVRAGDKGKAKICWRGIPWDLCQGRAMVVLFKNNEDLDTSGTRMIVGNSAGSYDTTVALNKGLQVRLHKAKTFCLFWKRVGGEIWRGPEFHNPDAERLVPIQDYHAYIQLIVKDGTACARLHVKSTDTDWQSIARKCWVGLYTSGIKTTNQYETWQWQWATKFQECGEHYYNNDIYYVYEYHSSVVFAAGVQARFIDSAGEERARTPACQ